MTSRKQLRIVTKIVGVVGAITAAEFGLATYFYRRTMIRNKAKVERTIKMAGTDWSKHMPFILQRKVAMMKQEHHDEWITSSDGLKLHGTWFPKGECKKVVICFHGYTSQGVKDYIGLSGYYLERGYSMLLVDERAHGESEGKYIGFGCLDRLDALEWIKWIIQKYGKEAEILLHGTSMGATTVLMSSSLELPKQVKGIISDCAFTSPKEVFTHVLKSTYHMPAFPTIQLSDFINKKLSGYGLDECNAAREVKNAKIPILLIHGTGDTFVPYSMCERIYENISSSKKMLLIEGAAHAECYYKDTAAYENALTEFIGGL